MLPRFFFLLLLFTSCYPQKDKQKKAGSDSIQIKTNTGYRFPAPVGYVNDYARLLKAEERQALEAKLNEYDKRTTNQLALAIIDEDFLTVENFKDYTLALSKHWGVGTKEKNNGLTIILSPALRKIRINTGLGTEKILTDEICVYVLDSLILPEFKKGNYYKGLDSGIDELIRKWH